MYSTEQIQKYVEQLFLLLPRSKAWGRIFQVPQNLFVKIADHYPNMDSPYTGDPSSAPVNPNTTTLGKLLSIFAIQMLRADELIQQVQKETIASTAEESLEEWEVIYRITDTTGTIAERQDRLQYKIDTQQSPRTFTFLVAYALAVHGCTITLENVLDIYNGDPLNFDGLDYDPWSGQVGVGEVGASSVGNSGWGGFCRINILDLGDFPDNQTAVEVLSQQVHAGTMVEWVATGGSIIMTTSASDTYVQTTEAIDTITQP